MRLPIPRRRRKSSPLSNALGSSLKVWTVVKSARAITPTAKVAGNGAKGVKRAPIKKLLLLAGTGAAAFVALKKIRAGDEDPYPSPVSGPPVAEPTPAPAPVVPEAPAAPPAEPAIDVDGPNESAPGHNPEPDDPPKG